MTSLEAQTLSHQTEQSPSLWVARMLAASEQFAEQPALMFKGHHWTHHQMHDLAGRLAQAFLDVTSGVPCRVVVLTDRSPWRYFGALACMLSGCVYVPLNRKTPVERIAQVVQQVNPGLILLDPACLDVWEKVDSLNAISVPVLCPDAPEEQVGMPDVHWLDLQQILPLEPMNRCTMSAEAYILFTSGSTGTPKGIAISHHNLTAFFEHQLKHYDFQSEDRFSQVFESVFDLSIFDIFMPLLVGGAICAPDEMELYRLERYVNRYGITVWFSTPSLINMVASLRTARVGSLTSIRWALFCGEPLRVDHLETWKTFAPTSRNVNLYGPTEATLAFTEFIIPDDHQAHTHEGYVSIGQVYPHHQQLLVPTDTPDAFELCVAGPQVFSGYLNRPQAQNVWHHTEDQTAYYRTGDLVQSKGGLLYYLARKDNQVQVNGCRVEIGEVEHQIQLVPGVEQCAVVGVEDPQYGTTRLVCVLVGSATPAEINQALSPVLPHYMIPTEYVSTDTLPLTNSGKVDRKTLAQRLQQGGKP